MAKIDITKTELGPAEKLGAGRSTRYRLRGITESLTNRKAEPANRKHQRKGRQATNRRMAEFADIFTVVPCNLPTLGSSFTVGLVARVGADERLYRTVPQGLIVR